MLVGSFDVSRNLRGSPRGTAKAAGISGAPFPSCSTIGPIGKPRMVRRFSRALSFVVQFMLGLTRRFLVSPLRRFPHLRGAGRRSMAETVEGGPRSVVARTARLVDLEARTRAGHGATANTAIRHSVPVRLCPRSRFSPAPSLTRRFVRCCPSVDRSSAGRPRLWERRRPGSRRIPARRKRRSHER